jgi:hypothetical protein
MNTNGKLRPAETVPEREQGDKGERFRVWMQLWYIVTVFVNVTMYPSIIRI